MSQPKRNEIGTSHSNSTDWRRLHLWQIQPLRDAILIAAFVGLLYLGSVLSIVTVPALLALMVAYLVEPMVKWMTRVAHVRRPFAAVMIIVAAGALVLVPAILGVSFGLVQGVQFVDEQRQNVARLIQSVDNPDNQAMADALPSERWKSARAWLIEQERLASRRQQGSADPASPVGTDKPKLQPQAPERETPGDAGTIEGHTVATEEPTALKQQVEAGVAGLTSRVVALVRTNLGAIGKRAVEAGAGAVQWGFQTLGTATKVLFGGFLTAFFFYFFCTGWGEVLKFWESLIPEKKRGRFVDLVQRFDRVIAGFVRGRLTIALCQMVLFTIGYWILGVPAAFVVGPLIGLLTLVPYVAGVGVPIAIVLLLLRAPDAEVGMRGAWWWIVGGPILLQAISQILDDYVLSPKIQGKNTDLNMPLILFASISGGVLGGVYGLLVAIPVAACLKIVLREVVWPRIEAWTRGTAADPLPIDGGGGGSQPPTGPATGVGGAGLGPGTST